jgi:hypothetical protein
MSILIDVAAEFTGKNAFKQADSATEKLTGGVKKLGAALGIAFGATAILNYSKNAVKAFAADEKAAKTLSLTLKNLGLQYADPQAKAFISDLEKQYGVLDDLLRPAFQKLVTTTKDFALSQQLLKTSLDLSAMSGLDVVTVSSDLAKAYTGNTKGLQKYGLGIDKATLATMSFDDILKVISKVSAGQADEAANSIAGSMERLQVASANASESIGKDLINALTTLGGEGGLPKTLSLIESLASGIGDAVIGISRLIRVIDIITGSGSPIEMIKKLNAFTKEYRAADAKEQKDAEIAARRYGGIYADIYNNQKKILTTKKGLTKEELAALAAAKLKLAVDKANIALGKGNDLFNMDAIQLQAAMINQTEQLGKVTTQTQLLAITNDIARLRVKQDILALEDAIASKDESRITAATNQLNKDMLILGALTNQSLKLADLKSILNSIIPKDLIDQANLDEALRKIKEMMALLAGITKGTTAGSPVPKNPTLAPILGKPIPILGIPGVDYNPSQNPDRNFSNGFPSGVTSGAGITYNPNQNPDRNYDITINAGTIANPDELTGLIQDTIIRLNKRGDYLTTAGAL